MANNSKQILVTVFISLITAILASVVTYMIMLQGSPSLAPTVVNANACDIDGTCETKTLTVEDIRARADDGPFFSLNFRDFTEFHDDVVFENRTTFDRQIVARGGIIADESLGAFRSVAVSSTLTADGDLWFHDLGDTNNRVPAYVCANWTGNLYRSVDPCDKQ